MSIYSWGLPFTNLKSHTILNTMILLQLSFFILFISGYTVVSYIERFKKNGWPIGNIYLKNLLLFESLGMIITMASPIIAFFFIKWYLVLLGIIFGAIIVGTFIAVFKEHCQWIAVLMFVLSISMIVCILLDTKKRM